jgi:hypothetical protein
MKENAIVFLEKKGTDVPRHITPVIGVLNFDDFGAQIGQEHRAKRTSTVLFYGNDTN